MRLLSLFVALVFATLPLSAREGGDTNFVVGSADGRFSLSQNSEEGTACGVEGGGKDGSAVKAEAVFDAKNATILGVVEGLTEYIPVSSTGHLIITNSVLGLDSEAPLIARGSDEQLVRNKKGEVVSIKNAADAYSIIIQFGAIIAVIFAYWRRVSGTIIGVLRRDAASWRLARNLIVAFIPAALLGFLFSSKIEQFLFNPVTVAIALIVGGILMLVVERRRRRRALLALALARKCVHHSPRAELALAPAELVRTSKPIERGELDNVELGMIASPRGEADSVGLGMTVTPPELEEDKLDLQDISSKKALVIGLMQCLALWPGMSRSMSTIVGGYVAGLSPRRATEFSFLLGLITLSAASIYKGLKSYTEMLDAFGAGVSLLGLAIAFVASFISVKWLVEWISKHGLSAFAWYRFALAAVVLVWALC